MLITWSFHNICVWNSRYLCNMAILVHGHVQDKNLYDILQTVKLSAVICIF